MLGHLPALPEAIENLEAVENLASVALPSFFPTRFDFYMSTTSDLPQSTEPQPAGDAAGASANSSAPSDLRWYKRIGPGLITACVVIGPGSITTSSQVGAKYGYSVLWVVLVSVALMLSFMTMAARLGVVAGESPATLITRHAGQ